MRNRIRDFLSGISSKRLSCCAAVLSAAVYFGSLIPLFILAGCNFPAADDYSMDVETHAAYAASHSVFAALKAAVLKAMDLYQRWQGNFTGVFMMSLSPAVYDESLYRFGILIVVGLLSTGVLILFAVLMRKVLGTRSPLMWCAAFAALFICVQCLPEGQPRVQGLFWYNGSIYYIGLYGVALIYVSLMLLAVSGHGSALKTAAAALLGFLLGGSNYMSVLCLIIISLLLSAALLFHDFGKAGSKRIEGKTVQVLVPTVLLLTGFVVSAIAPGNRLRGDVVSGYSPVKAVFLSFYYTLNQIFDHWMIWPAAVIILMLLPVFWALAKETDYDFAHPFIAACLAFGLAAANITAPLYATGGIDAGRISALFWMQTMILTILLEGYLTGWVYRQLGRGTAQTGARFRSAALQFTAILGSLLLFGSALSILANPDYYTVTAALKDLRNGTAAAYAAEHEERMRILTDPQIRDAVLAPYEAQPTLLYYSDVTDDPEDWTNVALASFYEKDSVVLESRNPEETD